MDGDKIKLGRVADLGPALQEMIQEGSLDGFLDDVGQYLVDSGVIPETPKVYKHTITHNQLPTGARLIILSLYDKLDENNYLGLQKIIDKALYIGLIPSSAQGTNDYYQIIMNRSSNGVNCTGYYFASTTPTSVTIYNPSVNGHIVDQVEDY